MAQAGWLVVEKYTPLYLKYRPQSLAELVGQRSVAQTLINAIEHDRISHAYLFTGPRGTGKTSSARILAKSLNCQKGPTVAPCQTCAACVEIREGMSPAVFELDAASNNSVDDARVLIERAPLVAQGGRFKLYIIDECHMLTKEAFNALLKTIEEPPPNVIFILATTEEHKVPPTIVSRCQRLMFKLVNQDELKVHLRKVASQESINIDEGALELVARRSGGGLRDALGLLDQAGLLSTTEKPLAVEDLLTLVGAVQEDVLLQISAGIHASDGSAVLTAVHSLLTDGREPAVLLQELSKHFLNLARACYNRSPQGAGNHVILGSPAYLTQLAEQAKSYDPAEIAQIVELLDKLEQNVRRSSQPAMNLEIGLLSICHRHDILMLKELQGRMMQLEEALLENGIELPYLKPGAPRTGGVVAKVPPRVMAPQPAQQYQSAPSGSVPTRQQAPVQAAAAPVRTPAPTPVAPPVQAAPTASPAQPSPAAQLAPPAPSPVTQAAPVPSPSATSAPVSPPVSVPASEIDDGYDEESSTASEPSNSGLQPVSDQTAQSSVQVPGDVTGLTIFEEDRATAQTPDAPLSSDPAVAAQGHAGAQSTDEAYSNGGDSTQLDEVWSDLLDALQSRHLPTYSILTALAFPVAFDKNELVIGVRKEQMQKMIEGKAEHIKSAFTAYSGKTIFVKVKVVGEPGASPAGSSSPRGRAPRQAAPTANGRPGDDKEEGEGARSPQPDTGSRAATATYASTRPEAAARGSVSTSASAGARPTSSAASVVSAVTTASVGETAAQAAQRRAQSAASSAEGAEPSDSGLINEAYRLFQGPGSRMIN